MVVLGDMIHAAAVQFPDPNVAIAYDIDVPAAVALRKRLFDDLAQQRTLVAGAHLSFPGLATSIKRGKVAAGSRCFPLRRKFSFSRQ
ncbi:hypothetical protein ACIP8G_00200 [Serratia liquefaciens]|uniref:hypothetical protein n=1 Tax=Serratia liquefaciens TaxID=614 RepID=UPI0038308D84